MIHANIKTLRQALKSASAATESFAMDMIIQYLKDHFIDDTRYKMMFAEDPEDPVFNERLNKIKMLLQNNSKVGL